MMRGRDEGKTEVYNGRRGRERKKDEEGKC